MKDETFIHLYLTAQLSPAEEQTFKQKVRTDAKFKQKVLIKVLLIKAFRNVGKQRDQEIIHSVTGKLTWKKYVLVYGVYSSYYFTDNMPRYNTIFQHRNHIFV